MNNQSHKNVIVIQHDELAYHPERYPEYNPGYFDGIDVCSLEYDVPALKENSITFYPGDALPTAGETYIRSPFDSNIFVNIAYIKDYIIQKKCNCLSEIAQMLGAKSTKGCFSVTHVKERKWDANGKIKSILGDADLSIGCQEEEKLKKSFASSNTYSGKPDITIGDWQRAYDAAKAYNIISDPTVENMLNALHPTKNGGNHMLSQRITCSMSTETNRLLDVAFNLSSALGIFKLNADFHLSTRYRYETILELEFEFPE